MQQFETRPPTMHTQLGHEPDRAILTARFGAAALRIGCAAALLLGLASGAGAESLTLRKIRETGVISLGYREGSIPFSYLDERQRPIGYSMDLCRAIVGAVKKKLGLEDLQVKLTPVSSSTRIPLVVNNTVDLECGTTTNTLERQKSVAFTVTTFVAHSRIASRRESGVRELADLRGRTIVSTAGTTSIALLAELNAQHKGDMNIVAGKDHAQSFRLLQTQRADAFAMDDVLLHALVATAPRPADYIVSGAPLSVEPYGITLRKGDPEFKQLADETLIALFRSGEIHAIYRKWFEEAIPPYRVMLNRPMSASLKKVLEKPTDSGDPLAYR